MEKPAPYGSEYRRIVKFARGTLIIGLLFFAAGIVFVIRMRANNEGLVAEKQWLLPPPAAKPMADRNAMGDPHAPVTIIEFSDFQCAYCRQFYLQAEPALIENEIAAGKVYFVYRSLGDWLGPESQRAAEASYCAADQEKFWEYHDALFSNQGLVKFSSENLIDLATVLGLEEKTFVDCLANRKYRAQVEQDLQDGLQAGVRGTPSFLINGKLIAGAQPYSVFAQEIEAALNATGK